MTKDGAWEYRELRVQMAVPGLSAEFSWCFWEGNGILLPISLING